MLMVRFPAFPHSSINSGQDVHTHATIQRGTIWYWLKCGHAQHLERQMEALQKEMAAYCRICDQLVEFPLKSAISPTG